jgi:hypothetical protein
MLKSFLHTSGVFIYLFLYFVVGALVGVVEGIRCYSCGTYITTSVTPCRNLSSAHLTECGKDDMFCSKYSNPAIQVYGCESKCEEKGSSKKKNMKNFFNN